MATKNSWYSAVKGLWNNLFERSDVFATLRWVFLTLLVIGFLWSLSLFVGMVNPSNMGMAVGMTEEVQWSFSELSELAEEAGIVFSARNSEVFFGNALARRYPFAPLIERRPTTFYASADERDTYAYAEPAPAITVKGVMLMGGKAVAVVLIGDEKEILAEAGYVFGDGKGKIESISPDKVVVLWRGKRKVFLMMPQNR